MISRCSCHTKDRKDLLINSGSLPHLILNSSLQRDPTQTAGLRARFVREMERRFNELGKVIWESIVKQDCFGLQKKKEENGIGILSLTPTRQGQFAFKRSSQKIEAFMAWLNEQENAGILEIVRRPGAMQGIERAWSDIWIQSAYQKGVIRARKELKNMDPKIPMIDDFGGIKGIMNQPFHADRLGALYTRSFSELKGIDDAMDQQISRILTEGIMNGKNPKVIARDLLNRVDKIGKTRARTLARTEIIRAHHIANITEYKNWGVQGVTIKAEWSTAGHGVCPVCSELSGKVFTLEEIEPMIPKHPNCRCAAIPVRDKTELAPPPKKRSPAEKKTTPKKPKEKKPAGAPPIEQKPPVWKPVDIPEITPPPVAPAFNPLEPDLIPDIKLLPKEITGKIYLVEPEQLLIGNNYLEDDVLRLIEGSKKGIQIDPVIVSPHIPGLIFDGIDRAEAFRRLGYWAKVVVAGADDVAAYLRPPMARSINDFIDILQKRSGSGLGLFQGAIPGQSVGIFKKGRTLEECYQVYDQYFEERPKIWSTYTDDKLIDVLNDINREAHWMSQYRVLQGGRRAALNFKYSVDSNGWSWARQRQSIYKNRTFISTRMDMKTFTGIDYQPWSRGWATPKEPGVYRWNMSHGTAGGVYRHETSHMIHAHVSEALRSEWTSMFRRVGKALTSEKISEYSAKNQWEFFAECFTMYTNPKFVKGSIDQALASRLKGKSIEDLIQQFLDAEPIYRY